MSVRKAILASIILVALCLGMIKFVGDNKIQTQEYVDDDIITITLWYTDPALTDYLNSAAVAFLEDNNIRVVVELHSGLEYIEAINDASLAGENYPDLFIVGSESIGKAAMSGVAIPVLDERGVLSQMNYPDVAINAITFEGNKFGYPMYYDTSFLLYNETYLHLIADSNLRASLNVESVSSDDFVPDSDENIGEAITVSINEAAPEGYTQEEWDALVDAEIQEMIPTSIEEILAFANSYQAPNNVENIFLWDVSDIFYNYFFAGAYMDVGGIYGDDSSAIDIYNTDSVSCMQVYQDLNEYFSIDATASSYEEVLNTFIDGKTIFMIATTDAFATINQAQIDGMFNYSYNVSSLPTIDSEHDVIGLSSTSAAVVNGYTQHREQADAFARFITLDYIDSFQQRTGMLATANGTDDYIVDVYDMVRDMYKTSESLPKLLELNNFWIELELAYTLIWEGEDVDTTLMNLQDKMNEQIVQ